MASVEVEVREFAAGQPINFPNQIVPIFSKFACNSGPCHGKASGQNGFRLSLLGFEPTLDYETLVKEGRGRRVFPAAPGQSLLLLKAVARVPHGGGKKLEPGSHEYRLIERWIGSGMPYGKDSDPTVARIEVHPDARVLPRGSKQQIVVTAHYTDGTAEDGTDDNARNNPTNSHAPPPLPVLRIRCRRILPEPAPTISPHKAPDRGESRGPVHPFVQRATARQPPSMRR